MDMGKDVKVDDKLDKVLSNLITCAAFIIIVGLAISLFLAGIFTLWCGQIL